MSLTSLQEPKRMSCVQPWEVRRGVPDLQPKYAQQSAMGASGVAIPIWEKLPVRDVMKELLLTQSLRAQVATIQAETPVLPAPQTMSPEMEWLTSHAAELSAYEGEWLLIVNRALVAHDSDFRQIHAVVQERGITEPFLYYVPTPEEANFVF